MVARRFIPLLVAPAVLFSSLAYGGCDSCITQEVVKASVKISTSLKTLEASVKQNVSATNQLKNVVKTNSQSLSQLRQLQHAELLSGLDAAAGRIEGAVTQLSKVVENGGDVVVSTLVTTSKNTLKAEILAESSERYGPNSVPISSDISANRAIFLREAMADYTAMYDDAMKVFTEWATLVPSGDATNTVRLEVVEAYIEDNVEKLDLLTTNLLTAEDVEVLIKLFRLLVLPEPKAINDLSLTEKIEYNKQLQRAAANYSVFLKAVLDRAPLIESTDWMIGYTQIQAEEGLTSFLEFEHSESSRKLYSPDWHLNMKTVSDIGLLREQVNQLGMTNYFLMKLTEQEQDSLMLTGMK